MSKSWPISVFSLICASFFVLHVIALPVSNLTDSSSSQPKRARQDDTDLDTEGGEGIIDLEAAVGGGDLAPSAVYLMSTHNNVATILNGLVNRNISHVLSGSTGFIPQGGLRNSVDFIVQQALIPNVQRVITDLQGSLNKTETTPSAFTPDLHSAAALASASHQSPQDIYRVPNQPRIAGSGTETTEEESFFSNPIKALQNRLQGLLPTFNFGSSSSNNNKNTNNNAPLNNNVRVNNANNASPPRVINVVNVNSNANRQRIPSPVRPNIPSSAVAS